MFDFTSFKLDLAGDGSREKAGQILDKKELWDVPQRGE